MSKKMIGFVLLAVLASVVGAQVPVEASPSLGRKIAQGIAKSLITVRLVTKTTMSFDGESSKQERKSEVTGVVIQGSGLTVVPLSSMDPSALLATMGDAGMSMTTDLTDIKMVLPDGLEIDARVVLRDKDLDLAFILPTKAPTAPLAHIDLAKSGASIVLDPVYVYSRLGKVANRIICHRIASVVAVMEKPRKRYVVEMSDLTNEVGSPVFNAQGQILGIITLKSTRTTADMGDLGGRSAVLPMVIPAADVIKTAAAINKKP